MELLLLTMVCLKKSSAYKKGVSGGEIYWQWLVKDLLELNLSYCQTSYAFNGNMWNIE